MADKHVGDKHIVVQRHRFSASALHWHNYFEMEIILEGNGVHIFNGVAYPVSKGDAYLLTPVDFHEFETTSPIELINISFDEVWLTEKIRTILYTSDFAKMRKFESEEYERFVSAADLLLHEYTSDAPCIGQLLEYLLSRFRSGEQSSSESYIDQGHLTAIKEAVAYIQLHFREKITLEQLSAMSGYNPTYFSELFRKITGETYIESLTALRINYAKMLLANGLSVSDACFASGFGSLSNFLAVFKAKCGTTPSEYRKKHKKTY